ncbi:hypothetical protein LINPERHAP1_LOCUS19734, partial [Linum perenne]
LTYKERINRISRVFSLRLLRKGRYTNCSRGT